MTACSGSDLGFAPFNANQRKSAGDVKSHRRKLVRLRENNDGEFGPTDASTSHIDPADSSVDSIVVGGD